jgi:hypothetical protein
LSNVAEAGHTLINSVDTLGAMEGATQPEVHAEQRPGFDARPRLQKQNAVPELAKPA